MPHAAASKQVGLFDRAIPAGDVSGAVISPCKLYRYRLWRTWDLHKRRVTFFMLNPSTADATEPDATVTRCISFAKREGGGRLEVVNLYGWRATQPKELIGHEAPVASPTEPGANAEAIRAATSHPDDLVVLAWGANAPPDHAAAAVAELRTRGIWPKCLGTTANGSPCHPVRLANATTLIPYLAAH